MLTCRVLETCHVHCSKLFCVSLLLLFAKKSHRQARKSNIVKPENPTASEGKKSDTTIRHVKHAGQIKKLTHKPLYTRTWRISVTGQNLFPHHCRSWWLHSRRRHRQRNTIRINAVLLSTAGNARMVRVNTSNTPMDAPVLLPAKCIGNSPALVWRVTATGHA